MVNKKDNSGQLPNNNKLGWARFMLGLGVILVAVALAFARNSEGVSVNKVQIEHNSQRIEKLEALREDIRNLGSKIDLLLEKSK